MTMITWLEKSIHHSVNPPAAVYLSCKVLPEFSSDRQLVEAFKHWRYMKICMNPQMEQSQYAWDGLKPPTRQLYNGSLALWSPIQLGCCNIVLHRFSIYGLRTQCNYRNAHFSQVKDLKPTIGIHWWIPVCTTSTKCSWTLYWIILFRPFRPMSTCFTTLDPARDETLWRPEPFQTCWIQPGQPLSGLGRAHCFRIRCL